MAFAVVVAVAFVVVVAVAFAVVVAVAVDANGGCAPVAVEGAGCNGTAVAVETVAGGTTDETDEAPAGGAACGIPVSSSYKAVEGVVVHFIWSNFLWLPSVVSTLQCCQNLADRMTPNRFTNIRT